MCSKQATNMLKECPQTILSSCLRGAPCLLFTMTLTAALFIVALLYESKHGLKTLQKICHLSVYTPSHCSHEQDIAAVFCFFLSVLKN